MNRAVIGFGSNIEPWKYLEQARIQLGTHFQIVHESDFIETEPVGDTNQPTFVNGAFLIETSLNTEQLKAALRSIEKQLGRTQRNGPRTIDLDIVIWNNEVVDPDVYERKFLKDAIRQILPNLTIDAQSPLS